MNKTDILNKLIETAAIAVIRMPDSEKLKKVIDAIYEGGITAIEITMTTPDALAVIEEVANSKGDIIQVGVGSVLDSETARAAINAGARYVVSPIFKPEIIKTVHSYDLPVMPGCFSPTEIYTAHEFGADIIKVFPADIVGMAFFRAVKAPIPQLNLMPTGGVSLTNAGEWLNAGACAVGVGSALLDKKAIAEGNYLKLTNNAKLLMESIRKAKS